MLRILLFLCDVSNAIHNIASNGRLIHELVRMGKGAVVVIEVESWCVGGLSKTVRRFSQDSLGLGRDSNRTPPEYTVLLLYLIQSVAKTNRLMLFIVRTT
jgi:hypothetical protein